MITRDGPWCPGQEPSRDASPAAWRQQTSGSPLRHSMIGALQILLLDAQEGRRKPLLLTAEQYFVEGFRIQYEGTRVL